MEKFGQRIGVSAMSSGRSADSNLPFQQIFYHLSLLNHVTVRSDRPRYSEEGGASAGGGVYPYIEFPAQSNLLTDDFGGRGRGSRGGGARRGRARETRQQYDDRHSKTGIA
jgi:hypothetical protein